MVRRPKVTSYAAVCFASIGSSIFKVISHASVFYYLLTEQSISRTWAQVEDSQRRELLLQAFRQRCILGRKLLSDDTQKISGHCQALEQMAR